MGHFSLSVILIGALLFFSVSTKVFTVEDLHAIPRVGEADFIRSEPLLGVYTRRIWDSAKNEVTVNLRVVNGKEITDLTHSAGVHDSNPKITPDGKSVLFLRANSDGVVQIHGVPIGGSEEDVYPVSILPLDIGMMKLFQRGSDLWVAFTMNVFPDCSTLECTADRLASVAARGANTWKEYDSLFVRHWDVYSDGTMSHIFVAHLVRAGTGYALMEDTIVDMLADYNWDSPVPPFGGLEQFDVSPDGNEIAFTWVSNQHSSVAWNTNWQICLKQISATNLRCLKSDARLTNPAYSPDGKWLAYLAMNRPGMESDKLHINRVALKSATLTPQTVTNFTDISFSGLIWDNTSSSVLADADYYGTHNIFAIDMYTKQSTPYDSPNKVVTPLISLSLNIGPVGRVPRGNCIIVHVDSFAAPTELFSFVYDYSEGSPKSISTLSQITSETRTVISHFNLASASQFTFVGAKSETVYGYVLPPANFDPSKKYPVVNLVHGGPEGSWNNDWSYRWNPQLWAARGYAVVMIDFHGSTGYGQAFTDSIAEHWGDYPYEDVMKGMTAAIKSNPYMDSTRLGACGASYGGYMINWIQGHTTVFKALVTHDGLFDTIASYYSTDELWFPEYEFGGTPWTHNSSYFKFNPAAYVSNWATPHLVIHGQRDYRLTIDSGYSVFTALQRRGIPSKLLYFTMENHWVLNDLNGIKWYHTVLDWLDKYVV